MNRIFSHKDVLSHNSLERGLWVIVDTYVLDLTSFLQHHPAGGEKIMRRRDKSVDISSNFLDHFGHTVRAFRGACEQYETLQQPVTLKFPEAEGEVLIIGKVYDQMDDK